MTSASRKLQSILMGTAVVVGLGLSAPAGAEELRIGYLAPLTGGLAQTGIDMRDGFLLYLEQHGNKLGGMDVKLIIEDEQGKGDVAVTKAKKLVLQDKVHMLIGGVLASTGYALAPVSTELKTMYIPSIPAADDLTQRQLKNFPYLIRTSWSSSQPHHPLGQWACDQGYKKIVTIAADYAFGYEVVGGFQKAFEDCGGKIVQKIWPPLGAKDFGPFIPTIKADTDAVFSLMVGPMPAQFIKQMRGAGFKKPIIGGGTSYDEFVLPFMGDEAIGDVSALHYSAALDTPKNIEFVKAYRSQVRQGAVVLLGKQLHDRAISGRGAQEGRRQMARAGRADQDYGRHQARCGARAGIVSTTCATRSRTSTSRRSRRRRCSATKRTSSGTRSSRPIRTSASSGRTARTSSWPSRSTTRISRPASSANNGDSVGARSGPDAFFLQTRARA